VLAQGVLTGQPEGADPFHASCSSHDKERPSSNLWHAIHQPNNMLALPNNLGLAWQVWPKQRPWLPHGQTQWRLLQSSGST
jgi:hypothetical protein